MSSGPVAGGSVLRRVAWNTAAQAAGKAVVLGIGLASVVITTRYLGSAGYGKVALAFAFVQMLGVLADVGLLTVVVREISRDPEQTDRLVGNALVLRLALSLVTLALAVIASVLLPWDHQVRVAVLIAGVPFVLGLVNSALVAVLQARLRMDRAAIADVVGRAASFAASGGGRDARPRVLRRRGDGRGGRGGDPRGHRGHRAARGQSGAACRAGGVAVAAPRRAADRRGARRLRDLLQARHAARVGVPVLPRGGRLLALVPDRRADRHPARRRHDLGVPPDVELPARRSRPRPRGRSTPRATCSWPSGCRSRSAA